jgi:hypothetical protein
MVFFVIGLFGVNAECDVAVFDKVVMNAIATEADPSGSVRNLILKV